MTKQNVSQTTINTVISLADNPESYVKLLLDGEVRSKIDRRVCRTLHQLAEKFLLDQKVSGSAYYANSMCLNAVENQRETLARLRDLQLILTNRAAALFYLNSQNGYDFGSFNDI